MSSTMREISHCVQLDRYNCTSSRCASGTLEPGEQFSNFVLRVVVRLAQANQYTIFIWYPVSTNDFNSYTRDFPAGDPAPGPARAPAF